MSRAFAPSYAPPSISLEVTRDPREALVHANAAAHEPLNLHAHVYLIQVSDAPASPGTAHPGLHAGLPSVALDSWGLHARRASELIQSALTSTAAIDPKRSAPQVIERVVGLWESAHRSDPHWTVGVLYRRRLDEDPRPELVNRVEWSTELDANLASRLTELFQAGYLLVLPKSRAGAYQYPRAHWTEREDARLGGRARRLAVRDWRELASSHTVELKQV